MIEIRSEIAIAADPARVWSVLCDQSRYPEWGANTLAVNPVRSQIAQGDEREELNKIVGPLRTRPRWLVTVYDPPRRQQHETKRLAFARDMTVTFELRDGGSQTDLMMTWRWMPTFMGSLLMPLFSRKLKRGQERSLAQLCALCEQQQRKSHASAESQHGDRLQP